MADPRDIDWFDLSHLLSGTERQRSAAEALLNSGLLEKLSSFSPVLCGTVPIDCDIPESDLDIVCHVPDVAEFMGIARIELGKKQFFGIKRKELNGVDSAVCRFELGDWPVEIVAQPLPVRSQRAFGHMLAEALLLHRAAPGTNEIIRALKLRGRSTEEAFASHFGLPGDPYEAVYSFYEARFGPGGD